MQMWSHNCSSIPSPSPSRASSFGKREFGRGGGEKEGMIFILMHTDAYFLIVYFHLLWWLDTKNGYMLSWKGTGQNERKGKRQTEIPGTETQILQAFPLILHLPVNPAFWKKTNQMKKAVKLLGRLPQKSYLCNRWCAGKLRKSVRYKNSFLMAKVPTALKSSAFQGDSRGQSVVVKRKTKAMGDKNEAFAKHDLRTL